MVRTISTKARDTIVHAARRSAKNVRAVAGEAIGAAAKASKRNAKNVRAVAGEAIGAAAKAATEVLLDKTNEALAEGHATLTRSSPAIQRAAEKTVRRSIDNPARSKRRKRTT